MHLCTFEWRCALWPMWVGFFKPAYRFFFALSRVILLLLPPATVLGHIVTAHPGAQPDLRARPQQHACTPTC